MGKNRKKYTVVFFVSKQKLLHYVEIGLVVKRKDFLKIMSVLEKEDENYKNWESNEVMVNCHGSKELTRLVFRIRKETGVNLENKLNEL